MEFHIWCNKRMAKILAPLTIVEDSYDEFIVTIDLEEETVTRSSQDTEVVINYNRNDIDKLLRAQLYGLGVSYHEFRASVRRGNFGEFIQYAELNGQKMPYAYFAFKLYLASGGERALINQ